MEFQVDATDIKLEGFESLDCEAKIPQTYVKNEISDIKLEEGELVIKQEGNEEMAIDDYM